MRKGLRMSTLGWMFVYTAISFYVLAAALLEHFGLFRGWPYVPESDFRKVRTVQGMASLFLGVVPKALMTVLIVVLLFLGLAGVSTALLWVSLVVMTISWVSSAFIQVPLQLRLQRGDNRALRGGVLYGLSPPIEGRARRLRSTSKHPGWRSAF